MIYLLLLLVYTIGFIYTYNFYFKSLSNKVGKTLLAIGWVSIFILYLLNVIGYFYKTSISIMITSDAKIDTEYDGLTAGELDDDESKKSPLQ